MLSTNLMKYCVYTIKHSDDLAKAVEKGGKGKYTESKPWRMAEKLFAQAKKEGFILPVIFAFAERTRKVRCWARITDIKIAQATDGTVKTTYSFDKLTVFPDKRYKKNLVLKSTGKNISSNYIRPYAICVTPEYILK